MPARPEIFISATTKDLKSCRQLVRDALLTLGCVPVMQDHFAPESATVREMLRGRIAKCDAVIHLAGMCYGHEPQERAASEPRRSYAQMEYDIARELGKRLYAFVCAPDFPYEAHEPEDDERRILQEQHRAALAGGDRLYLPVRNERDLEKSVREMRFQVRSWIGRLMAVGVAALGLVGGLLWTLDHRTTAVEGRNVVLQQQNDAKDQWIAGLEAKLDEQTRLSQQILDLAKRNAPESKTERNSDPVAAARAQVAAERGIGVEDIQKQLAGETADVKALLAQIEKENAAAQAQADRWRKLKRVALTKLGDGERAAGHYREAVDPYRQALALCDEDKERLVWCDAAQNLEIALDDMGRYVEAEPLARRLVERRTAMQGTEHPDTLRGINNLANVLCSEGDYLGAKALYRRVLEARERTLGEEHPDTLASVNNLANVLYSEGDYVGAQVRARMLANLMTSGVDLKLLSDPENYHTGVEAHYYVEAEVLYRRALEARERTLGKEHPDTLASVNNLANVLKARGQHASAEALYRYALEAYERTLGKEHPDTLASVNNLAALLRARGDLAGAEALFRRVLEARERTLGKEHPDTAMTAYNFSLLQEKQGKLNDALELAEEALASARVRLPADHPYRRWYERQLDNVQAKIAAAAETDRKTRPR